jgi:1-acyl-sn-glycerol-3-phosphate acyltransferase
MFLYLRPRLDGLVLPVALYVAAIVAMMWRAAARGEAAGLAGALCFAASDSLIALDRFVAPVPGARYAIMALYWAGQMGIAASTAEWAARKVGMPELGPSVPSRGGRCSRAVGALAFDAIGWRVAGRLPDLPQFVVVVAPHTSNWDFVVGVFLKMGLGLRASFLAKHSLFWWPLGTWLRYMGGIPVDRSQPGGVVESVLARFRSHPQLVLAVTPSGTRRKDARWKTGFYNIARGAGVPVVPVAFDYGSRTATLGDPVPLSGDTETDMAAVQAAFATARGRNA